MKKLFALRGATVTNNTAEDIQIDTCELCNKLFTENGVKSSDIVSIQFTVTKDLKALNPATALRHGNCVLDVSKTALFCSQEPDIDGSMEAVVRVMVTTYLPRKTVVKNQYLNGAANLRK